MSIYTQVMQTWADDPNRRTKLAELYAENITPLETWTSIDDAHKITQLVTALVSDAIIAADQIPYATTPENDLMELYATVDVLLHHVPGYHAYIAKLVMDRQKQGYGKEKSDGHTDEHAVSSGLSD
ncbi:MAG: hypothetical protein K2F99_07090 [Muribaculaceae bacterium]|nr:hypothetical protein [Muribaculaceae bacterium]